MTLDRGCPASLQPSENAADIAAEGEGKAAMSYPCCGISKFENRVRGAGRSIPWLVDIEEALGGEEPCKPMGMSAWQQHAVDPHPQEAWWKSGVHLGWGPTRRSLFFSFFAARLGLG